MKVGQTLSDGRILTPSKLAWFQRRIEQRKMGTHCPRCGGERGERFATCDKCRGRIKLAKLKAKGYAIKQGEALNVEQLAAMVVQMRREMDKMHVRFKLWQKAVRYRAALKYRTQAIQRKYFQSKSKAETMDYLQQTNHAYDHP